MVRTMSNTARRYDGLNALLQASSAHGNVHAGARLRAASAARPSLDDTRLYRLMRTAECLHRARFKCAQPAMCVVRDASLAFASHNAKMGQEGACRTVPPRL